MGIEVRFKNEVDIVNKSDAPHNSKFGNPNNLQEAIQAARGAHKDAGGEPLAVDGEDVVIVDRGDNLWKIWEKHAKPQGITWEEFLASNKHLQKPTNLGGTEQPGWKEYHLVHKGDVVFIPDRYSHAGSVGGTHNGSGGVVVKNGDKLQIEVRGERGSTYHVDLKAGDTITYNGVTYKIVEFNAETGMAKVQPVKPNTTEVDPTKPATSLDLNQIAE